jgi:hypothetical protein
MNTIYCCNHCAFTTYEKLDMCPKCFGDLPEYELVSTMQEITGLDILQYYIWKHLPLIAIGMTALGLLYIIF